ncbi:WG repeat-containing protein [Flavobacterium notoginsengisoli]|uniref:WG repeat-containing protein n=1 Tax=Flavobacterium notoginsengisoli TaxID=1478199 RepID=UPI00363BFFEE
MKFKYSLIISLIQLLSLHVISAQTVYYDNASKLYGVIDKTGKIILKPTIEQMTMFESGLSRFKKNEKWGLINETGMIVFQPKFDDQYAFCNLGFNEGLISVSMNGKFGYYSEKGILVIPHKYDSTGQFCNGIAWVELNEKYCFINMQGKYISNKWFDNVKIVNGITYGIDEKKIFDKDGGYYNEGKPDYYIINKDGSMSIAENQDYLRNYQSYNIPYCDIAAKPLPNIVSYGDNGRDGFGYKNSKGEILTEKIYSFAGDFDNGFAIISKKVLDGYKIVNDGYCTINEKFEIVKELDKGYEPIWGSAVKFENGLIELSKIISNPGDEIQKKEYYLINNKGDIIKTMDVAVFPVSSGG